MLNRRNMLKGTALGLGAAALGMNSLNAAENGTAQKGTTLVKRYENDFYYDKDGNFLVKKAKQAFFEMFDAYHYQYPETFQDDSFFWVIDFGLGDFANCGMGGVIWLNRKNFRYFSHDIFLLPGQQIAEHSHVVTDEAPAKMETWHVRYGSAYNWSEGEPTIPAISKPAASQIDSIHCNHCELIKVGDVRDLNELGKWHFLQGGPEGVIITESATYHDGNGLRFSNPKIGIKVG